MFTREDRIRTIGETPWQTRKGTHAHYRHFERLIEVQKITDAWVLQFQGERSAHEMDRGQSAKSSELWVPASPIMGELDEHLDDTSVEEVLERIEKTVWAVHAYALDQILTRAKSPDLPAILGSLEQTCWRLGKLRAETSWKDLTDSHRGDLRNLIATWQETPFCANLGGSSLLIVRLIQTEVRIEFLGCAHHSRFPSVRQYADELCSLHSQWLRGFGYGLNPKIEIEIATRKNDEDRCSQRWQLA